MQRKRNEKRWPVRVLVVLDNDENYQKESLNCSLESDSAGAWVQRVPKQKLQGQTGGSWHCAHSWHHPTRFLRINKKKNQSWEEAPLNHAALFFSSSCKQGEQLQLFSEAWIPRESGHQAKQKGGRDKRGTVSWVPRMGDSTAHKEGAWVRSKRCGVARRGRSDCEIMLSMESRPKDQ